jgi:hypothetical protein
MGGMEETVGMYAAPSRLVRIRGGCGEVCRPKSSVDWGVLGPRQCKGASSWLEWSDCENVCRTEFFLDRVLVGPWQCKGAYSKLEWNASFNYTMLSAENTAGIGLEGRVHSGFAKQAVSQLPPGRLMSITAPSLRACGPHITRRMRVETPGRAIIAALDAALFAGLDIEMRIQAARR